MTDSGNTFQAQVAALRRAQILDAAAQVFAERGFHRTTIRDVAKAAGVADGTIYNYFENKTALLLGILDRLNDAERRAIESAHAEATDLRSFTRHYFQNHLQVFADANQDLLRVVLSEVLVNAELRERYIQQIVAPTFVVLLQQLAPLAEQGGLRSESLQPTIQLMSSMLLGVLMAGMFDEQSAQSTWEQLPDLLTDLFCQGLFRT
ncbi:MAG TPA: TetR/AcrR family transcriptional regulator [Roseiflexaceae bacterium]|nr:TetR/AcrR family transcriptional regulator [Roseiflexaceae bacterium]